MAGRTSGIFLARLGVAPRTWQIDEVGIRKNIDAALAAHSTDCEGGSGQNR